MMNVTEFAERIVFGTTLEEKLSSPSALGVASLSFDPESAKSSRTASRSIDAPSRPKGLEMSHITGKDSKPPRDWELEKERARGELIHFLANHELLATELMALVLLKFPDAPYAFRRGVLETLQEEQTHTLMYLNRMKECGVELGSFPLSGQFWRLIEPMESPMDFVSRLSLTFEQANLDYSLHYCKVFAQIGDCQTSDLLRKIYEDEIGHVRHGLQWFRQWKSPEQSDWEAYSNSLHYPLSPQRGRGTNSQFNRAGRKEAGLDDDFINAIELFRQSRGRTPTVHWFDPAAEAELTGLKAREIGLMKQLRIDLELVMLAMCKQDDILLVQRIPSQAFQKKLLDQNVLLPEFVDSENSDKLTARKLHDFSPWAWTPTNHQRVETLVNSAYKAPPTWNEEQATLFTKSFCVELLRDSFAELAKLDSADEKSVKPEGHPPWLISSQCSGIILSNVDDLEEAVSDIESRGYSSALFKQDLGTSGRGQRRISCINGPSEQDLDWLGRINRSQNAETVLGIVEPELDRILDLSFLWHLPENAERATFLGWSRPMVGPGRRYLGTRLREPFVDCEVPVKRFLLADRNAVLVSVSEWIERWVVPKLCDAGFSGYFGVDSMVCRELGELKIKPLVELNPRMTMGHIAMNLEKKIAPGAVAEFRILTRPQWDVVANAITNVPIQFTKDKRWKSGAILFSEVERPSKLVPLLVVGRESLSLLKALDS